MKKLRVPPTKFGIFPFSLDKK